LGIRSRAIFSFEDFLLSRYHMFATVYLHYTPVIFEKMLAKFFETSTVRPLDLPADVEAYTQLDDVDLWAALRKSTNPWAKRIVERKPFVMLDERQEGHQQIGTAVSHDLLVERLNNARIEHIRTKSKSVLSKYFGEGTKKPIYVVTGAEQHVPLEEYTPLYSRYSKPALLERVFVDPDKKTEARAVLERVVEEQRAREIPNTPSAEA
jgi:HD superfamily phosphohydrolase